MSETETEDIVEAADGVGVSDMAEMRYHGTTATLSATEMSWTFPEQVTHRVAAHILSKTSVSEGKKKNSA